MQVSFILDTREHKLRKIFDENKIKYSVKQLDLGDIIIEIENDTGKYYIIIERKSYTDLKASLTDGRYRDQKSRYLQLGRDQVYYILENNDPEFSTLNKEAYYGMYIHTIIRDKIGVILSNSIQETFILLLKMAETFEKFGFNTETKMEENTQIKKKKAVGIDVYKNQLCCISGISIKKANEIVKKYDTMEKLIFSIKNNTFEIKGFGKVLIKNIKEGLLI
jgi:ERCC4-type nuclease